MNIASSTNARSVICAPLLDFPCNHSLNPLRVNGDGALLALAAVLNSYVLDAEARARLGGLNLSFFVLDELAALDPTDPGIKLLSRCATGLLIPDKLFAPLWCSDRISESFLEHGWRSHWALTQAERRRVIAVCNAIVAALVPLSFEDLHWLLRDCALQKATLAKEIRANQLSVKGFWREDKDLDPELRQTVLTLVAFKDLEERIRLSDGNRYKGITEFLDQNERQGWLLPEALRLSSLGLAHEERAKEHQPVASRLGPRFYDWQLAQSPEESWRECHLHARNLLGEAGYRRLVEETNAESDRETSLLEPSAASRYPEAKGQRSFFE